MDDLPKGSGPLADTVFEGPIDDPSTADRANPRWADGDAAEPHAQPTTNADGSPNVMPPRSAVESTPGASDAGGTPQDQAAQESSVTPGSDNIRQGLGEGQPNPALAEGGEG